ncbi:MAG: hypothetical protein J0I06_07625 [Planctomycetes bacterium]|nr:hypothetical protein [Planctomycetota bacterium]
MPVRPLATFEWQVLRTVKRSPTPPTGKQLRLVPSRRTKDGTFLDDLVNEGLLQVVGVDDLPAGAPEPDKRRPVQFRTRYALTAKGEHAAEYGEYTYELKGPEGAGTAGRAEQARPKAAKGRRTRQRRGG